MVILVIFLRIIKIFDFLDEKIGHGLSVILLPCVEYHFWPIVGSRFFISLLTAAVLIRSRLFSGVSGI